MFHGDNYAFLRATPTAFCQKVGLTVVLRWSYDGLMIQYRKIRSVLSTRKGTKNVRETSDMFFFATLRKHPEGTRETVKKAQEKFTENSLSARMIFLSAKKSLPLQNVTRIDFFIADASRETGTAHVEQIQC